MKSLVWFRRDLRVTDNSALFHAANKSKDGIVGLFVITPGQWRLHNDAHCKVKFWLNSLTALSEELAKLNIPLRIETCDSFAETPDVVGGVLKRQKCSALFFNREYEVNEARRDRAVTDLCGQNEIEVHQFHDRVIIPPKAISTKQDKFYSVFTPYRKVWDTVALERSEVLAKPRKQTELKLKPSRVPSRVDGFDFTKFRNDLWPAGEKEAKKRLKKFSAKISDYGESRDIPGVCGTSLLSPYLAAGAISPRQCLSEAIAANRGRIAGDRGATTWISELTWRDFYVHVLVGFPRVSMNQPFKPKTNAIHWRTNQVDFEAWKLGRTGYPIVDAGMRQLNQTGWMHNRLRMVTAMFLTKNLLIDWRLGEKYFMQKLIDGDLAANNGGWQWSASTGTDSVPYFRIFNPFSQSKRFDPEGAFIKKLCPELNAVSGAALHDPAKLSAAIQKSGVQYPEFIVDYNAGRERALKVFKEL